MKKVTFIFSAVLIALVFASGCVKDTVTQTYTYKLFRPIVQTTAAVRANIKSNAAAAILQPGKLYIKDHFIFLNEVDKGVHIIDNSNPADPKNVAFINIPGNVDIAVKENTLYADLYTDLVAIDISNPRAAKVTKVVGNVFQDRFYGFYYGGDSDVLITDWVIKDTTVTEEYMARNWRRVNRGGMVFEDFVGGFALSSSAYAAMPGAAKNMGGSMARFAVVNKRLYAIGQQQVNVFNVDNSAQPQFVTNVPVGFGIETLFPFKDKLFIGSTNGMFIYSIANPDNPAQLSLFTHVQSCDPVITDGNQAYVTLRSGTVCNGITNQLDVLDVANVQQPLLIKTYPLTHPQGLSKDGNLLFICDDGDGLKIYDATKPEALQLLKTITGLQTYDVIAFGGRAIVVAKDGLYQFDYSDIKNIRQLSKLTLN
ncbi:MAG TPA: hypothetical protein VM010_02280 [Chitinophagaceae bacterium]|nr:hypothetical protein [Chitinophagaceae bacterium]